MWRNGLLLSFAILANLGLRAQFSKSFIVANNHTFDKVKLSLNATNGHCLIEPGPEVSIMDIQSRETGSIKPDYSERVIDRTKLVKVELNDPQNTSLGTSLSRRMFSSNPEPEHTWKVHLSRLKPMELDLNYAVGDTYIDLSGLPVERLKMHTGSANVKINYMEGQGNRMVMDTFLIKVDMGTFVANNLHLANSKMIIADVGFGKVRMDFEQADLMGTVVKATVGAGKLEVILPKEDVPVRINVNDSPLCNIKIPAHFEKRNNNVFVSRGYGQGDQGHIDFNVDVAVGHIVFRNEP